MRLQTVIVGRGMAGQAMERSLGIVETLEREIEFLPARYAERGVPLRQYLDSSGDRSVLFVANPHALHTATLLEAVEAGFDGAVVDKPAAVTREQIEAIRGVRIPVGVSHGYRGMWGPQRMKRMLDEGVIGELFSIEGFYRQSSAAEAALISPKMGNTSWKNDPSLSGPSDTLFDIGSHWVDMASWFPGAPASRAQAEVLFVNALAPHRDTHVHLDVWYGDVCRGRATISKTHHGASNDFEISLLGTAGTLTWRFLSPDEVVHGRGSALTVIRREECEFGSGQRPFHGLGWLEGYVEVAHQVLRAVCGLPARSVPTLKEQADLLDMLLTLRETGRYKVM